MKKSFLFLAPGFEEIEALGTLDMLRRAGMDVSTVSIHTDKIVKGAHGVPVTADMDFKEADFGDSDWLILPGGMPGATNLYNFHALTDLLKVHKGRIAAICASPAVVLAPLGILKELPATCFPGFEDALVAGEAKATKAAVAITDKVITAHGPGATFDFALAIIEATCGEDAARQVASGMLLA